MKTAASSTRITERIWDRWSPYREQETGNRHKTNHTWSEIDRFDLPYPRCAAKIRITLQNGPLAQLAEQLTLNQHPCVPSVPPRYDLVLSCLAAAGILYLGLSLC